MEKQPRNPVSTYGHSCTQCFKAKCRCVARTEGHGCERCWRLKKQCQPSESIRRRNTQNHETGAQIAKLEGRIEALTSMLQSVVTATGLSADLTPSSHTTSTNGTLNRSVSSFIDVDSVSNPLRDESTLASSHSNPYSWGTLSSLPLPQPLYEPTPDEAEDYLNLFRERMLPMFPFMYMSPDLKASQLRQERPFLFRAVVAVATASTQQKVARIEELKCLLTKVAVLDNQSNVDMLLSILTYIAWSTDPFIKRASSLSRMIMLAISMVYDLKQSRSLPEEAQILTKMAPGLEESDQNITGTPTLGLLEQQRAFLACFFLSSIISSYFKRIDAIRWTSQMEEGLRIISMERECPSDEVLAYQVRLQLLAQKVGQVREQYEADRNDTMVTAATRSTPVFLYLKVLQEQLKELKNSLSPHLLQSEMLFAYAHYVDLCINEVTRVATSDAPLRMMPESGSILDDNMSRFEPLDCLWRCLHAVKSWLDAFFKTSPDTYVGFPFFYWFQLVRCIIILKHLSTFDDPVWDCQAVNKTVDLLEVLDRMAEKAELASKGAAAQSDDDLFHQVSIMLRRSQAWINAKVRSRETPNSKDGEGPLLVPDNDDMTDLNQMPWMDAFESGDQSWFEGFFGWSPKAF